MTLELGFGQSELAWGDTYMKIDRVRAVLDGVASLRQHRMRTIAGQAFILPHSNAAPNFTWLDRAVAEAADRGIRLLICINKTLPLAYSNTPTIVANLAQAIASRYGVTGFTYNGKFYPPYQPVEIEIWNEVNLSTYWYPVRPADYTEYLKASYTAIKSVLPGTNSIVVSAGLAGACGSDNLGNVKDSVWYTTSTDAHPGLIASGALDYMDAFGFHPYSSDEVFHAIPPTPDGNVFIKLAKIRQAIDDAGHSSLPIWFTEWGFCVVDAGTPEIQRDWDVAQLAIFDSLVAANPTKYGPAYRYNYNDDHNKPTSREATYGVTYNPDFSHKPSWDVFNARATPSEPGSLSSVGTLTARVAALKKPRLSSVGTLSVKLHGRVAAALGSTGTLSVAVAHGGHQPVLSSEGTLSAVAVQQRIYTHAFTSDGSTKPTSQFTDFGPYGYTVTLGKANNGTGSSNGFFYDGGIYHLNTLTADQLITVEQAEAKSFADRSMVAVGRANGDGTQAIFATMRWGGSDSSQILMLNAGTVTEMAHGTMKLSGAEDKLGLRIDGDVYTVLKNGDDTDCQWIDTDHVYPGRTNKGVGFGFQHKRIGGVNYNAPSMDWWQARDLYGVAGAVVPSRTPALASVGTLSTRVAAARNGILAGAGTLAAKAAALKKPALSSTGTLSCVISGTPHGNLASIGTLTAKAAAAKKGLLTGAGTLTARAAAVKVGALAGGGTLTAKAVGTKAGNLSGAGTLTATAVAAKTPALSSTGTLSVSVSPGVTPQSYDFAFSGSTKPSGGIDFSDNLGTTTVSSSTMREGNTINSVNGTYYAGWLYPSSMSTAKVTARANSGALTSGSARGFGVCVHAADDGAGHCTKAVVATMSQTTTGGWAIQTWDGTSFTVRASGSGSGTAAGTSDDVGLKVTVSGGVYTYQLQLNQVDVPGASWTDTAHVMGTPGLRWGPAFKHTRVTGVQGGSPGVDEIWCADT